MLPDQDTASPVLSAARDKWDAIRENARGRYFKAGPLLRQAHIKSAGVDQIEVGFQFRALLDKAQEDPKVLVAIREAATELLGRPVQIVPVLWEELQQAATAPAAAAAPTGASRPAPSGGHLLEEALKFGAVPVEE